jgi:hypothetical protein
MSTVTFTRRGDTYSVRFRFDRTLVELIKDVVPSYARSWDASAKQWTVAAEPARVLASAMRQLGHQVIGLDPPNINGHNNNDPAQWAKDMFHRVGPNRIDPVHRALTKVLNPDTVTGDTAIQQELNDARADLDGRG